jgi:hypothetical protein
MAMQDRMTRLFDETLSRIWKEEVPRRTWSPPVDILEREGEVILKVDLPEVNQNDICQPDSTLPYILVANQETQDNLHQNQILLPHHQHKQKKHRGLV